MSKQEIYQTEKYSYDSIDEALDRREHLMDLFTPNGSNWNELEELLEIERQLTLDEGE